MKSVMVTGGAGYIGSHMVQALLRAGYRTVILDNLSTGHRAALRQQELVEVDLSDRGELRVALRRHRPSAILHFAASCSVAESVEQPLRYYRNNVAGTLQLLEAALEIGVPRFIFSSSASVYGEPEGVPIEETHPTRPINPYGRSKRIGEQLLEDAARAFGIRYVSFRYFNAAGADPNSGLGEDHRPENHLIPLAVRAALNEAEALQVYGDDYDTRDGSCIRDFVHVLDLVDAHLRGLHHLENGGDSLIVNLGTETGTSVMEVLGAVERVTGLPVPHEVGPRRPGDPAVLVASNRLARSALGWAPRRDLDEIIRNTYDFMKRYPEGYPAALPPGLVPQPQVEPNRNN